MPWVPFGEKGRVKIELDRLLDRIVVIQKMHLQEGTVSNASINQGFQSRFSVVYYLKIYS